MAIAERNASLAMGATVLHSLASTSARSMQSRSAHLPSSKAGQILLLVWERERGGPRSKPIERNIVISRLHVISQGFMT